MTPLFPYQEAGAEWLCAHPHRVLADEMGLGKTAQAISACDILTARRMLIICPAVARINWVREFKRFSVYAREFMVLDESPAAGVKYRDRSLVMSYERAVILHAAGFFTDNEFSVLILDEAHYLKNPYSKRTVSILGKTGVQTSAKRIWALTGTPVTKDIGDLWPFLFCFGAVKYPYGKFLSLYCFTQPNPNHYGMPRVVGLRPGYRKTLKGIINQICLRRTVKEVLPELPEVISGDLSVERGEVELTPEMRETIEAEIEHLNMSLEGMPSQQAIGILEMLAKSCSTLRRYLGMQKVAACVALLKDEVGIYYEKVVVFTVHKAVAAGILEAFPDLSVGVTGDTSPTDRQKAIDAFQMGTKVKIFVANINAAGTAINLTAAHHIIFVEQEWTPAQNEQAIARCRRIGQDHPVQVRTLTVSNSIDEAVSRVLRRRQKHISEIISS